LRTKLNILQLGNIDSGNSNDHRYQDWQSWLHRSSERSLPNKAKAILMMLKHSLAQTTLLSASHRITSTNSLYRSLYKLENEKPSCLPYLRPWPMRCLSVRHS